MAHQRIKGHVIRWR